MLLVTEGKTKNGNEFLEWQDTRFKEKILAQKNHLNEWHLYFNEPGKKGKTVHIMGYIGETAKERAEGDAYIAYKTLVISKNL